MKKILDDIFEMSLSEEQNEFESALSDLRYIIERHTMNRYSESERKDYITLFSNKNLIDYKLKSSDINLVKYFLFYILFNFSDRAIFAARGIKVLFDKSIWEAICNAINIYLEIDDHTTCELVFGIINLGDSDYFSNEKVINTFKKVIAFGGPFSREAVLQVFINHRKNYNSEFEW